MVYTHTHIRMHTARRVPSTTSAPTKIFIARIKHVRTRNLVIISDVLTCVRVCAREREQVLAHFPRNKPTQNKTYTKSRPEFSHQIIPRDMRQTALLLSFIYELFTPLSHTRPTRHMSRVCSPTTAAAAAPVAVARQFVQKLTYFCQTSGLFCGVCVCVSRCLLLWS